MTHFEASSKGMYQSGFRQNVPWQKDDKYPKLDDDRREGRIPPRGMEIEKRMITERKSRSPVRRDRSPLRDRFKRHSPSPRSPRRSWALEKRRSPEVIPPPPPVWPGQKRDDEQFPRRNIPDRMQTDEKTRHQPVWEIPSENKDIDRRREDRRPQADDRKFPDKGDRRDIVNRELRGERFAPQNERSEKFSPKFSPREFDDRCDFHPNEEKRFNERQDRRDLQRRSIDREDRHREEIMPRPRNASPHHMDEQNVRRNFDKELEDIYKKAVEFRKKTEELRRSGERRREGYGEDGREYKESAFDHPRRPSSPSPREYRGSPSKDRRPVVRDKVEWKTGTRPNLPEHIKAKREKATNEIVNRLLERQTVCDYIEGDFEQHVKEELKIEISKIIQTIFGNDDVAYIEIIIKYQAKFSLKDEELMLRAVLNCLPTPTKTLKRSGPETSEVAAKTARRSSPTHIKKETSRPKLSDANTVSWSMNIEPPKLATVSGLSNPIANPQMGIYNTLDMSQYGLAQSMFMENNQQAMFMNQNLMATQQMAIQFNNPIAVNEPAMVPAPYVKPAIENKQEAGDEKDVFSLYLCHEDFQPFTLNEANELKRFLFSKIVEVTETSRGGWAPDIIIKGLQSNHRYELQTKDSISRDWLLDLNFRELSSFNLVIYTKEELWYERAAIWLPGHSRNRKIEPIEKLKLQNNKLNNINIGKWKLVKKIVNDKGTRLFVDMPPASARALDKYKMMLSYELQKVNVFRKATAVDKNAFDETMKEISAIDTNSLYKAAQNAPLPIINDHSMVKITLKNCKTLSIEEAHKIKEVLIYNIFRYHQMHGTSRTDFVKYGFCKPKYFGVVPENIESKQWLLSRNFGKLKDKDIIVVCDEDDKGKLFPMRVIVDSGFSTIPNKILERVKSSNQGVKGLHFNRWKADLSSRFINEKLISLDIHVDIDSLETLKNLNYQLDYVTDLNKTKTITFKSSVPYPEFEKILKQYKTEMVDSYDVANMELDSDDENQDVICLN